MYSLQETFPRGFFSNFLSILTSSRYLNETKNCPWENLFIDPSCFSLYGHPANWFVSNTISHQAEPFDTLQSSIWGCADNQQLQMQAAQTRFPWNTRVQALIDAIAIPDTTLGLHFRGLDHDNHNIAEGCRQNLDKYLILADNVLANNVFTHVFIASDEQGAPENIKKYIVNKFPHIEVLYYDHLRLPRGRHGLHSPSVLGNKILAADQAIIDAHALAKCQAVIGKSTSNFMNWCRFQNPNISVYYVDHYKRRIQPFIFNWPGQTAFAKQTYSQLKSLGYNPTVINSDPGYQPFDWINVGNDAWFSHQWNLATDLFTGDILFHIQADATYDNWAQLINDAELYLDQYNWGIYSPRFQDNGHYVPLEGWQGAQENIKAVPNPDCTCWFLHRDIIAAWNKIKPTLHLEHNKYGWGIDCILCAISWHQHRIVLRDFAHEVYHKPGRGYNSSHATDLMFQMFAHLDPSFYTIVKAQWEDKESLLNYIAAV